MKTENGTPYEGGALLAGLKALVDSLPPQRRTDLIKTLESVLGGMNADYHGRHSFDLPPESTGVLDPTSPKASSRSDSDDEPQNKIHE